MSLQKFMHLKKIKLNKLQKDSKILVKKAQPHITTIIDIHLYLKNPEKYIIKLNNFSTLTKKIWTTSMLKSRISSTKDKSWWVLMNNRRDNKNYWKSFIFWFKRRLKRKMIKVWNRFLKKVKAVISDKR